MKRIVQALLGAAGLGVLMLVFAGSAQAADLGTVTVSYGGSGNVFTPTSLTGQTGDTFTLVNTRNQDNGISYVSVVNGSGAVTLSGSSCTAISSCPVYDKTTSPPNAGVYTVVEPGTFSVMRHLVSGGSPTDSTIGTLTISGSGTVVANEVEQTPPSYQFTYWLPGTPAVECGPLRQTVVSGTQVALPGADADCKSARSGLVGWSVPGSTEVFAPGAQVIVSGDQKFTAVFADPSMWFTQNSNVGSGVPCYTNGQSPGASYVTKVVLRTEVKLGTSAPCAPAGLSLKGWNTKGDGSGTTYAPGATVPVADVATQYRLYVYAIWGAPTLVLDPTATTVETGALGAVTVRDPGMAGQTVAVSASGAVTQPSGASATVTLGADGAASVAFIAGSTAGTGRVTASAGGMTATATITVIQPETKSITITGSRTTVSGKPGITVDGVTVGLEEGSTVKPFIRFPGETTFVEGTARPVVTNGSFTWQRKTGKKTYVYFTSSDGKVQSNRVIIPAN